MTVKGITLNITDDLINYVVKNGSNKAFGARPMNRFIQDSIEGEIANLMLKNEAVAGKTITFAIVDNKLESKID